MIWNYRRRVILNFQIGIFLILRYKVEWEGKF